MKAVARAAAALLLAVQLALVLPALRQCLDLARIFASRLTYPADIEWMEGGALLHAHRLLHGLPIYGAPDTGFLPYPYPPGHYVALAAFGGVVGLDYYSGRLVSIAFFLLSAGLLGAVAWNASSTRREGALFATCAIGACAASFPVVGGWYDVVRNDSLAIALVLSGAWLLRPRWRTVAHGRVRLAPSWRRCVAASLILCAAVFTKQTAVFFIAWIVVFTFVRHWRAALLVGIATGLSASVVLGAILLGTRGWFWTYVFSNLSKHPVIVKQATTGLELLYDFAPFLVALPVAALALLVARRLSATTVFWLGMLGAAFPAALLPFAKAGGFLNNLIPVALMAGPIALLPALDLLRSFEHRPRIRTAVRVLALAGAASFLLLRRYDARPHVPTAEQKRRATAINAFVASLEGGVIIPSHPWLAIRNGQPGEQLHEMSYQDSIGAGLQGLDVPGFLARSNARWALMSGLENPLTRGWFFQSFEQTGRHPPTLLPTMTGFRSGVRDLLRRREPVRRLRAHPVFDFEEGALSGWTVSGDAFARGVWGERGGRHVNTWHPKRGDAAKGTATSPPFRIDRTHIGFAIGGGQRRTTRVELLVADRVVTSASGVESDVRIPVRWDVRGWAGQMARLSIVDEETGAWGHVVVDDVELFDVAAP